MMRLFDTHCHFDFEPFSDDFASQLQQAHQHGVTRLLIPAIGPSNWQKVIDLSSQYPSIYYALGFHPYFLDGDSIQYLQSLETLLSDSDPNCVAVGECGLDAMIDVEMGLQEMLFIRQIELASQSKKPLILHARKTHNRLIQLFKQYRFQYGGILHGFSGSYQQAQQFIELGFYIGVGGVITYPRANKTRQAIAQLPLERLVLETDAPDMPLSGHQGEDNHPKMLAAVLDCLAELRPESKSEIGQAVWDNSSRALGLCE